jgi:hypothetical protein
MPGLQIPEQLSHAFLQNKGSVSFAFQDAILDKSAYRAWGDTPMKAANCRALIFIGAAGPKVNADARDSTSTANPHQISIG